MKSEMLKKDPNVYPRSMQFPTIYHHFSSRLSLSLSLTASIHSRLSLYHPDNRIEKTAVNLVETHEIYFPISHRFCPLPLYSP